MVDLRVVDIAQNNTDRKKYEIYHLYLETYLSHLPEWVAKDKHSIVRILAESQAAAIAAVVAKFG